MTKINQLSDAAIRSKVKEPGYYLDGHGLYLQVSKGGTRSWILRYSVDKKARREMGLGSVTDFGLAEAREMAREARRLVAEGVDPIEARRQRKSERAAALHQSSLEGKTFQQCAREYLDAHEHEWKSAKHGAQWESTLATYVFPKFGAMRIGDVGKSEIVRAMSLIWKSKAETATRTLQRIRLIFNYAAAKDYLPEPLDSEFWKQVRMALGGNSKARKVKHFASCPFPEVGRVLKKVWDSAATERVKLAFEFAVLNASRSGEVRGARLSEFDADLKGWTIPGERMKAGRPHRVPLSKRAQKIIRQALELRENSDGDLLFASASGRPFSDMVFTQLLRRLGEPYTMHGFRSSFRTWADEATQFPHEMLEFALAHVISDQTVRAYARSDMLEKRRELMNSWADYIHSTPSAAVA
jgi:integrase